MKLPRDCGAPELVRALTRFGYRVTRQTGSHIRLTKSLPAGEHHITVPNHTPIKVGTLSAILKDVAVHHQMTLDALIAILGI